MSAAWHSGLERRFYDDYDRKVNGSTPKVNGSTLVVASLDKMLYDDYLRLMQAAN